MNKLEIAMINNIAIDHPVALQVIEHCRVLTRSFTGSGSITYLSPIVTPLLSELQRLKTPNIFIMDGLELAAELHLNNGMPKALEIKCLNWSGWDGTFNSFTLKA